VATPLVALAYTFATAAGVAEVALVPYQLQAAYVVGKNDSMARSGHVLDWM
jgi:hypothetical protein